MPDSETAGVTGCRSRGGCSAWVRCRRLPSYPHLTSHALYALACQWIINTEIACPVADAVPALLTSIVAGLLGSTKAGKAEEVAAVDSLCDDVTLTDEEEAVCQQVHALLPTSAADSISLERVRKLHRQDKANSFLLPLPDQSGTVAGREGGSADVSVLNSKATGRAVAIYPRVLAMANHSCWPSAVRIDPSPEPTPSFAVSGSASATCGGNTAVALAAQLSYRALEDLAAGTEVTQSYVGIGWPQRPEEGEMSAEDQARFVSRKDYLQHEYGFQCACTRCKIEDSLPDSDDEEDEEEAETDLESRQAKEETLEALQEQV